MLLQEAPGMGLARDGHPERFVGWTSEISGIRA